MENYERFLLIACYIYVYNSNNFITNPNPNSTVGACYYNTFPKYVSTLVMILVQLD